MQIKRVVIIANGEMSNLAFYRRCLRDDDYIICADGGANKTLSLAIKPRLVIGDMDSADAEVLRYLQDKGVEMQRFPAEKEKTDLELSIDKAVALNPQEILLLGAGGRRLDHLLANVFMMALPVKLGILTVMLDEAQCVCLLGEQVTERHLMGDKGSLVSLIPLTKEVEGVTTLGLKYPLSDETLNFSSSRGVSNVIFAEPAAVKICRGLLLVIEQISDRANCGDTGASYQ